MSAGKLITFLLLVLFGVFVFYILQMGQSATLRSVVSAKIMSVMPDFLTNHEVEENSEVIIEDSQEETE